MSISMLSTEDSIHVTLINVNGCLMYTWICWPLKITHNVTLMLTAVYQCLMYMLSTEDNTNVILMLTAVYQCMSIYYVSTKDIAHM